MPHSAFVVTYDRNGLIRLPFWTASSHLEDGGDVSFVKMRPHHVCLLGDMIAGHLSRTISCCSFTICSDRQRVELIVLHFASDSIPASSPPHALALIGYSLRALLENSYETRGTCSFILPGFNRTASVTCQAERCS
jgi:hypothetical protein